MTETETKVVTEIQVWMPDGAVETYYRTATEQLKIAIIGPPKSGKSWLAATAPKKPIYHFNCDGRLASISGKPKNFGKEYLDTTIPSQSTAWADIERDMGMFEYEKLSKRSIPGTFVFDPIDALLERAHRKYLVDNQNNTKDVRKMEINKRIFLFSNSWAAPTNDINMVGNLIARGMELGADVIAVFHERAEEAPDSGIGKDKEKKFTGKVSVHPPRAEHLIPLFNEYWRILPTGKETYTVYTKPEFEAPGMDFIGATCLNIDAHEKPDITQMIEKHKQNKT